MYNLKRNTQLYIVTGGYKYKIELYPEISMSQTFSEQATKKRTLHNQQALHEGAVINKAAPANFNFTTPIFDQTGTPILITLGTNYTITTFDIYVVADNVTYKVEKSVIETLTFNIERNGILTLSVAGSASKISPFSGTIPGDLATSTPNYTKLAKVNVSIDSVTMPSVVALHIDIATGIDWQANTSLHNTGITYPTGCYIKDRRISGSITEFITSDNSTLFSDTSTTSHIIIDIYSGVSDLTPLLSFDLPSTVFTRRLGLDEFINRVYDFRLNTNSTTVKPLYKGA